MSTPNRNDPCPCGSGRKYKQCCLKRNEGLAAKPLNLNETFQQAVACHQAGQFTEAEKLYLSILKVEPGHPDANHNLGLMVMLSNRAEKGLPYLQAAWEADPSIGQYWLTLTECLLEMGHFEDARLLIEEAIRRGIESPQAQQLLLRAKDGHDGKTQPTGRVAEEAAPQNTSLPSNAKPARPGKFARKPAPHAGKNPGPQEINALVALFNQGRYTEAASLAQAMTERFPRHGFGWMVLGAAFKQMGRTTDALPPMQKAAALSPNDVDAHSNLGVTLKELGRMDEAEASLRRALRIKPDHADAHNNLGIILHALGRMGEAEASYRRALQIKPGYAEAHSNLGNILMELGRIDEAETSCRRALQIKPDLAETHCNLGTILQKLNRTNEAEASYRHALQIKPAYAEAHYNLGDTLKELGRLNEAEASYRRALGINPDYADAHNNLGITLMELGRMDEAEASCRRALAIKPDFAEAYINLGNVLQHLGQLDSAQASYRRALEIKPDYAAAHSSLLFTLNYHPDLSAEEIYRAYQEYDALIGIPLRSTWRVHGNDMNPYRRLRIGYVSPDFRSHSCRSFLVPLLAHHDKALVEVYAYAELDKEDDITARYKSYVEHWIPTKGMSDASLAERIRSDSIDILVDLAGHTTNNRLLVFARKPAPVSVSWLGYGYTTGLGAIDYYLTDEASAPIGSEGLFAEQLWRIATPAYAYHPTAGMGEVNNLPAQQRGYITFGTLTRSIRINHRTIRVWAEILKTVPNSRLVMDSLNFKDPAMQEQMAARFAVHGIARDRLEIGYHSPPWDTLRGMDIGLDCFPHNSGTTLFETLYMGIPYITLASRPSVGRLSSSILQGAGHPEWIAVSEDDYVARAVELASDIVRLSGIRSALRGQMEGSPLMDETGLAHKVEEAYRRMWEIWCETGDKT